MKKVFAISVLIAAALALSAPLALAQESQILPSDSTAIGGKPSLPTGNLKLEVVPTMIKIFLALSGSISMIVFVYAGVMLIISQGNEEEITKFKNILIWSVVGLIFVTTSYALVRGILQLVFQ